MATGFKVAPRHDFNHCDACQLGKLTRPPHPLRSFMHNTTLPLQLVVMDLAGPVRPTTLGGKGYIFNLFDVFTRFSWTILIKPKDQAAQAFKEWLPVAERQSGTKLQVLRLDSGGEFTSHAFSSWLAANGVTQQTTPPRSPESNGMAERLNRTLQDKCRTMMIVA